MLRSLPVVAALTSASPAHAIDSCPAGYARKATWVAGSAPMPSSCRLSQCKPFGAGAAKTGFSGSAPPVFFIVWQYRVDNATAPANYCPADVEAGPWH